MLFFPVRDLGAPLIRLKELWQSPSSVVVPTGLEETEGIDVAVVHERKAFGGPLVEVGAVLRDGADAFVAHQPAAAGVQVPQRARLGDGGDGGVGDGRAADVELLPDGGMAVLFNQRDEFGVRDIGLQIFGADGI